MSTKIFSVLRNPFINNVSTVASGTVISQIIVLAFTPVITRLYGPETFGVLGIFLASSAILVTIGSLTYQIAIVLPNKDDDAKAIAILSLIISIILSSVLALILVLFKSPIISLLHLEEISSFILMIPVFIFFSSCHRIIEQWIIRTGQFKKKAKVAVVQAFIIHSTKSGIGLVYPTAIVLVLLSTFSHLLHTLMLYWALKKNRYSLKELKNAPWFSIKEIKKVALRHKDFPLYRAPQALLDTFTKNLPLIIIASFFGPVYAGFYTLSQKAIKNPAGILSDSVGKVFYPWISQAHKEGKNIKYLLLKTTTGMAGIGLIPFGTIILFGPSIFGFVFGSEWVNAGLIGRWLSLWFYIDFIRVPSVQVIPVIGIHSLFLLFTVFSTLIRLTTLIVTAIVSQNEILTVALFCLVSSLLSLILIIITILKSNKDHAPKPVDDYNKFKSVV